MNIKYLIIYVLCAFLTYSSSSAQECPDYYPLKTGTNWEMKHYDAKDKLSSSTQTEILSYTPNDQGYELKLNSKSFDQKGEPVYTGEFVTKCVDGVFYVDMRSFLDPASMSGYQDMSISYESQNLEFPSNLEAGMAMNDGSLTMTVTNQGVKLMTISTHISNRKVEGKEDITVEAGSFSAWKISYDIETKIIFKTKMHCVEYFVPGKGNVRTESYNEKGKLTDYSVLSSFSE